MDREAAFAILINALAVAFLTDVLLLVRAGISFLFIFCLFFFTNFYEFENSQLIKLRYKTVFRKIQQKSNIFSSRLFL